MTALQFHFIPERDGGKRLGKKLKGSVVSFKKGPILALKEMILQ